MMSDNYDFTFYKTIANFEIIKNIFKEFCKLSMHLCN